MTAGNLDARKRRILFRATHRGMKELDILFGRLAREVLDSLDETGVVSFERLLEVPDIEVLSWVSGSMPIPEGFRSPLTDRLLSYRFDIADYENGT